MVERSIKRSSYMIACVESLESSSVLRGGRGRNIGAGDLG